jgi:hypothetical protein
MFIQIVMIASHYSQAGAEIGCDKRAEAMVYETPGITTAKEGFKRNVSIFIILSFIR